MPDPEQAGKAKPGAEGCGKGGIGIGIGTAQAVVEVRRAHRARERQTGIGGFEKAEEKSAGVRPAGERDQNPGIRAVLSGVSAVSEVKQTALRGKGGDSGDKRVWCFRISGIGRSHAIA